MDACFTLLLLTIAVLIVAAVGHGLWVLGAAILSGFSSAKHSEDARARCPACAATFGAQNNECPACGLLLHSDLARELRDLDATARQIQSFSETGQLERGLAEEVYGKIEARQAALLNPRQALNAGLTALPPLERLERFLSARPDFRRMSLPERKQALASYRQVPREELARLSPRSLLPMARILRMAGSTSRALHVYDLLLSVHPQSEESLQAAPEAGRFAFKEYHPELAKKFLQIAASLPLSPENRQSVAKLLAALPARFETAAAQPTPADTSATPVLTPVIVDVSASPAAAEAEIAPASVATPIESPVAPRRSFSQMMAGFMEERNILWGELVGGLLIVGCSIALVISLWRTLEEIPYFPFIILAALTAGIFGAGLYTLSHWKLESTSRGLLVIATLLTPLDFLVLAGLSQGHEAGILDWAAELFALAGFTWLVLRSGRVLLGGTAAVLLTGAVIGPSASQLLVPRWLDTAQPVLWLFVLLSLAPALLQAAAVGLALVMSGRETARSDQANKLFLLLGLSTFAVVVALGFIVYWSDDAILTIRHLAIPIAVAALPLFVCGAFIQQRLGDDEARVESPAHGLSPTVARLTGTIIAFVGAAIMVGTLALAWPRPVALLLLGGANALIFGGVALRCRLPYVHALSLACAALAFLTAFHGVRGELGGDEAALGPRLIALAATPPSGSALCILAVVLAASAELILRAGKRSDGLYHAVGSGIAGALALFLTGRAGMVEPGRAGLVFSAVAMGGLLANLRWRQAWLTTVSSVVLLGAVAFAVRWHGPSLALERVALLTLLIHATVMVSAAEGVRIKSPQDRVFAGIFRNVGLTSSLLAVLPLAVPIEWSWLPAWAAFSLWLAAVWLLFAWQESWPVLFAAFQAAVALAAVFATSAWLHGHGWAGDDPADLFLDRNVQVFGLTLGALALVWALVRRGLRDSAQAQAVIEPGWRGFDWVVLAGLTIGHLAFAGAALIPAIAREVIPTESQHLVQRIFDDSPRLDPTLAWSLQGMLALVLAVSLWGSRPKDAILGIVVWSLTLAGLLAYGVDGQLSAGSALRWSLAALFIAGSILLWNRTKVEAWAQSLGIGANDRWKVAGGARVLLLSGTLLPILTITTIVALIGFGGGRPAGPVADSLFARIGWTANVVIPLLLVVVGLTGHALSENAAGYVFAAGLVLLATVTGGHALSVVTGGGVLDGRQGVYIGQLAVLAASVWGLAWLRSGRWRNCTLLMLQVCIGLSLNYVLLMSAFVELISRQRLGSTGLPQAASWTGWLGLAASALATVWVFRLWAPKGVIHILSAYGLGMGVLAASVAIPFDASGWLSYHVLTLAWTVLALALLALSWTASALPGLGPLHWSDERRRRVVTLLAEYFPVTATRRWVEALSLCVVLLALGGAWSDPTRPYWSSGATLAVSILIGALAVWARRPWYVYASGLLLNVVAFLVWQAWLVDRWGLNVWFAVGPDFVDRFVLLQVLALALGSLGWSLVENHLRRREPPVDLRNRAIPYAHVAAQAAVHILAMLALVALGGDLFRLDIHVHGPLLWLTVAATAVALIACLWDSEASLFGLPVAPLYLLGLVAGGFALHQRGLAPRDLGWYAALLLAGYVFLTALVVRTSPRLAGLACRLRFAARSQGWLAGWFIPAQALVALLVLGLSLWICLGFSTVGQRLAGAVALSLVAAAVWLMARPWPELAGASSRLRDLTIPAVSTLVLVFLTAAEACWALLPSDIPAQWLHRNVLVLAVLVFLGVFYRIPLLSWLPTDGPWTNSARRLGDWMLGGAAVALGIVLVQEFALYDKILRTTPLEWPGVFLVAALLVGLMVGGIWLAVRTQISAGGEGIAQLSVRARVRCVWAVEILLVLLFVHMRLNVPDLFPSYLGRNWAFVMMALGFAGVGLAEVFRRRGLEVLAGPLHLTGLFLPLLPLIAFLVRPLAELRALDEAIPGLNPLFRYLERLPNHYGLHALLWFLLGLLYAMIAVMRRGTMFALLAAVAVNFGLWVIYAHQESLRFLLHPQIWLLPVGLIILAAEYLHRARLKPDQAECARYAGLLIIYLSSSADMFITGVGHSFVLPIVLALLSVAGVLAGILLRVRAFLFLGVSFLFLVVFAQIWHAAVDRAQTWVWWASGIVLGAAILTLFALFEKRKNDVLRVLDDLKRWR